MKKEWTCHSLDSMATTLEEIKDNFLFEMDEDGMAPIATQHYLASLGHLELAIRSLKIAHFHQMKGE